jgi:hypothetical protein
LPWVFDGVYVAQALDFRRMKAQPDFRRMKAQAQAPDFQRMKAQAS